MLIKNKKEIVLITENGVLMGQILQELRTLCKPGMSTYTIDLLAEKKILAVGGKPAFKGYMTHASDTPFPGTICASVNTDLVHAIPRREVELKDGDIFTIDIGMEYPAGNSKQKNTKRKRGYYTDTAITFSIGKIPEATRELLRVTKEALEVGIRAAQPGNSVASIGKAIETYVKSQGSYGVVRDLVGHGVGHEVHEQPNIPNYYDPGLESVMLKPGMVIAIEPMISISKEHRVVAKPDGWTIAMRDNALSAHFEHTVVITAKGNEVVTRRPNEDKEVLW